MSSRSASMMFARRSRPTAYIMVTKITSSTLPVLAASAPQGTVKATSSAPPVRKDSQTSAEQPSDRGSPTARACRP